jgi:hypothetical protein
MSLREYIYFETGKELPQIRDPFDKRFTELAIEVLKQVDVLKYFRDYREHGTRPFYKEGNFKERMSNVIEKSIYADIPYFLGQLMDNHLGVMRAIISHLAFSKIPTVNVEAMCRDWNLGKEKLYRLLWAMEGIGLINLVRKTRIEKPYSKGAKIFFADPAIYSVLEGETANFREAFVAFALKSKGEVFAEKDETKADLIFNNIRLDRRVK